MTNPTPTRLFAEIAAREADLIALTQDLVRIATLNPPGRHYHQICDFLGDRLARKADKRNI